MCRACVSSLVTDMLTSGVWRAAPSRRQFMAYAISGGAAVAGMAGPKLGPPTAPMSSFATGRSIR
jgi:hypothetical protein